MNCDAPGCKALAFVFASGRPQNGVPWARLRVSHVRELQERGVVVTAPLHGPFATELAGDEMSDRILFALVRGLSQK